MAKDVPQALKLLAQSAEAGNEFASYTLGKTFLEGKEVAKDIPRAITYLEQAVTKDNPFAQYLLGKTLLKGEDVAANPVRGEQLLTASAAQGNPYAAQLLKHYRQNKNWAAAMGAFRLLQHMAGVISAQLHSDEDGGRNRTDRKLRRKIDKKKMLHGIRG